MQTQTTDTNTTNAIPPASADDVVRRGIKRVLPCKLTDGEFMEISKTRVAREALRDQVEADLAKTAKKFKDQLSELEDEIAKMGRELHTGEQDRTVLCNEVFRRHEDGTGYVHTVRMDTSTEVEYRPATVSETQRYLPTLDVNAAGTNGSVLDQARSAQATPNGNGAADSDDVVKPEDMDDEDDDADDDADDAVVNGKSKRKAKKGK